MAIDLGAETATYIKQERTWRIEIFLGHGVEPTIIAHREIVRLDPAGNAVSTDRSMGSVQRKLSDVTSVPIDLSAADGPKLAAAIDAAADIWSVEDKQASAIEVALVK